MKRKSREFMVGQAVLNAIHLEMPHLDASNRIPWMKSYFRNGRRISGYYYELILIAYRRLVDQYGEPV